MGDPAASVARAMGALFLQPDSRSSGIHTRRKALVRLPMERAGTDLSPGVQRPRALLHHSGQRPTWRTGTAWSTRSNRFGMVFFNSSGGPDWFNISGGQGPPGDIPPRVPASVTMIHSFSAANPSRSANHRRPLAVAWGVCLFRLGLRAVPAGVPASTPGGRPGAAEDSPGRRPSPGRIRAFWLPMAACVPRRPTYRLERKATLPHATHDRIPPGEWRSWRLTTRNGPSPKLPNKPRARVQQCSFSVSASDDDRLRWCLDASIGDLTARPSDHLAAVGTVKSHRGHPPATATSDWRNVLRAIHRERLDHRYVRCSTCC